MLKEIYMSHGYYLNLDDKYIIEQYLSGRSYADIALELKCTDGTIRHRLIKNNIQRRTNTDYKFTRGIDLKNRQFTNLVVLSRDTESNTAKQRGESFWKCKCKCGRICIASGYALLKNITKCCHVCVVNRSYRGYKDIPQYFWNSIISGAKTRNLEFKLTIEYAWNLYEKQNRKCALSGLNIFFNREKGVRKSRKFITASLDRIDSSLGYIENNVQWVHKDINFMKQDLTQNEFIKYCILIAKYYNMISIEDAKIMRNI